MKTKKLISTILLTLALALTSFHAFSMSKAEGLENVAKADDISIEASSTGINIIVGDDCAALDVNIYALTGQIVKSLKSGEGLTTVDLTPGYYIVKVGSHTKRVIIR